MAYILQGGVCVYLKLWSRVPLVDLHKGIPPLATLRQYEVVLVFTASWSSSMMRGQTPTTYDRRGLGDLLADYVDTGGHTYEELCCTGVPCTELQVRYGIS